MKCTNVEKITGFAYRGVAFLRKSNKWIARVNYRRKNIHLGSFSKLIDAINARDIKATELFGEKAITNKSLIKNGILPPITNKFDSFVPDILDLSGEIWKDVINFNGKYLVSNFGRVKSLKRKWVANIKILTPYENKKGYLLVQLDDGRSHKLHRLVARAFIPNLNNLPEINHKDLNKKNNHIDNLEWSTHSDNYYHAVKKGAYSHVKLNFEKAEEIRNKYSSGYFTCRQLANIYGVSLFCIRCAIHRKTWNK